MVNRLPILLLTIAISSCGNSIKSNHSNEKITDDYISINNLKLEHAKIDAEKALATKNCKLYVVKGYSYMTLIENVPASFARKKYGIIIIRESQDAPKTASEGVIFDKSRQYIKVYNAIIANKCYFELN